MYPFHLALQVRNIDEARRFYRHIMGCGEGRSADTWVDFDFYGHQLVCHLNPALNDVNKIQAMHNPVDGHGVPVPHFGIVLDMETWQAVAEKLKHENVQFVIEPCIRFKGLPGEQATLFFHDPSGNAIEIKGFRNIESELFAT